MRYDPDIVKAARCLMDLYGADATAVAEKRARNVGMGPKDSAAMTWRRIAGAVCAIEQTGRAERRTRSEAGSNGAPS